MYSIIQSLKSIDIKYGSKYEVPNKSIIPIFTNKEDSVLKSIYISSPKFVLPWQKTYDEDENTLNIEFANENHSFIKRLKQLCISTIKNRVDVNEYDIDINQIKVYENGAHTLRFFNVRIENVSVYNENGVSIDMKSINRDDSVKILFHLNGIVIKGTKLQLDMKLIQIMKCIPYADVNQHMSLIKHTIKTPPPPPSPLKQIQFVPKPKMAHPMSSISKDDLLNAMSKLKKRDPV